MPRQAALLAVREVSVTFREDFWKTIETVVAFFYAASALEAVDRTAKALGSPSGPGVAYPFLIAAGTHVAASVGSARVDRMHATRLGKVRYGFKPLSILVGWLWATTAQASIDVGVPCAIQQSGLYAQLVVYVAIALGGNALAALALATRTEPADVADGPSEVAALYLVASHAWRLVTSSAALPVAVLWNKAASAALAALIKAKLHPTSTLVAGAQALFVCCLATFAQIFANLVRAKLEAATWPARFAVVRARMRALTNQSCVYVVAWSFWAIATTAANDKASRFKRSIDAILVAIVFASIALIETALLKNLEPPHAIVNPPLVALGLIFAANVPTVGWAIQNLYSVPLFAYWQHTGYILAITWITVGAISLLSIAGIRRYHTCLPALHGSGGVDISRGDTGQCAQRENASSGSQQALGEPLLREL